MNSILRIFSFFVLFLLIGCHQSVDSRDETTLDSQEEITNILNDLTASNLPRSDEYQELLDTLYNLGLYGFDEGDLKNCSDDDLESYYLKRQLPNDKLVLFQQEFLKIGADDIFDYVVNFYEETYEPDNDQLVEADIKIKEIIENNPEIENNILMHLIWMAGEKGNIAALNEIGAAQIYCYQSTEQDIENAITVLERAAENGDALAMMTLGKVYYSGLGGFRDKEKGREYRNIAFSKTLEDLKKVEDIPDGY